MSDSHQFQGSRVLVTGAGTGIGQGVAAAFAEAGAYNIPAGFVGRPHDVASLASDEARYIVGQTVIIDGGQLSLMPCTGDFRKPVEGQFGKDYVPEL